MKINFFKLFIILLLLSCFSFVACKKDVDEADKFLGNYNFTFITSNSIISSSYTGTAKIEKISSDKVKLIEENSLEQFPLYTVYGDAISEDNGFTHDIHVDTGGTLPFKESSTGIKKGDMITINGSYSYPGYYPLIFKMILTKK